MKDIVEINETDSECETETDSECEAEIENEKSKPYGRKRKKMFQSYTSKWLFRKIGYARVLKELDK